MRHGDKINNLGRTASHRRALLANLTISLIEHKRITTTLAKAKALRRYAEPLITKSKDNSTHSRRVVFSYLQNKEALTELFGPIAAKISERPGGYLRVIKLGFRRGDGAETAMIEFVDFNETYNPNAGKTKTAKKTRRGGKKAAVVAGTPETAVVEEVDETPAVIEEVVTQVEEEVVAAPVAEETAPEVIAEVAEETAAEVVAEVEAAAPVAEEAAAEEVAEAAEETPAADETPATEEEEKKD
ncbi:MAG: 50S ribosomal protein L17 [Lewinellaceae bacterium]|nr:50S ribosomal protein L17 [Lewinellaceae bacterium]